jgi:hypothetical protein
MVSPDSQAIACPLSGRNYDGASFKETTEVDPARRLHRQAISNKCDRSEPEAADNFGDHHCGADANNGPGFSFVPFVCVAKKHVRVTKIVNRMAVHMSLQTKLMIFTYIGGSRLFLQSHIAASHYWRSSRSPATRPGSSPSCRSYATFRPRCGPEDDQRQAPVRADEAGCEEVANGRVGSLGALAIEGFDWTTIVFASAQ